MGDTTAYAIRAQQRSRSINIRGIEYHISEWGDPEAPRFVYLHGWADVGSTFQFVVDSLKSDWHVIAPDWRGFGRSAHSGSAYWFPDYLADLHRLLEEYAPDAPARLVGHSMGANVCSLYAGAMPERVSALVNIEGFGLPDSDPADAPQRYRDWLLAERSAPKFSSYADFDELARRVNKRNPGMDKPQAEFVARQWARETKGQVSLRADPNHKLPNAVLYRRAEAKACWRNVTATALIVSGDRSPYAITGDDPDACMFPNSQLHTVNGAGHMIHFEQPELLAGLIEEFLTNTL